jgi:ribosomal protein S15P/S13E
MGKKSAATAQIDAILAKAGGKKKAKGGKKNRKIGRYAKHPSSMRYKGEMRWIRNRLRRMERHLRNYPNDSQAVRLLAEFREAA